MRFVVREKWTKGQWDAKSSTYFTYYLDTDQTLNPTQALGDGETKAYIKRGLAQTYGDYTEYNMIWKCTANCCDDDLVLHRERCNTCDLPGEGGSCSECKKHWDPDTHCEECKTGYWKDRTDPENNGNERCAENNMPGNLCVDPATSLERPEMCDTGVCKDSVCCSADVVAERCSKCSEGNGVVAGGCLECSEGYTGKYCTACVAETHFLKGDECVPKLGAGVQCIGNQQCQSTSCNGVQCCATRELGTACEDCGGVNGTCISCKKAARSPESGCKGCIDSYYMPQVGSGSPACVPKKDAGFTCSSDIACLSTDCKRNRCCDISVQEDNPQCNKCGTMDSGGLCAGCESGYTIDPEDSMCKKDCPIDGGGGVKHHNELQERLRYFQENVNLDFECNGVAEGKEYANVQTQSRTCSDGTWLDWGYTESTTDEPMFANTMCVKGCKDEKGRDIKSVTSANYLIAPEHGKCIGNRCPPVGLFNKNTARKEKVMYKVASEEYGGKCQVEKHVAFCKNGAWQQWMGWHTYTPPCYGWLCSASKDYPDRKYDDWNAWNTIGTLDKTRVLFTSNRCSVECAPGCTAQMRDDDLCHDECENVNCCYNYGACAKASEETLSKARWAVISGDKVTAKPLLEKLCYTPSYNPESNRTGLAACTMLSSVNGGYDYFGNEGNFVHPLQWEEYELVINGYAKELSVIENRLGEAEILKQGAEHFGKLRNKMLLLSLGQQSITDQVTQLDASTQAGFAQIDGLVQDLAQEQRDQFAKMQENFDEVMVGQESALLASNANFNALEQAEQERFSELQQGMQDGFDQIREDIEVMEGNILLGQDALGDAIEENGDAIEDMSEELTEMKNILLENQDMLQEMLNSYTQDKQALIGLDQTNGEVFKDFKPKPDECIHDTTTGEKIEPDRTVTCFVNSYDAVYGIAIDGKALNLATDAECISVIDGSSKGGCTSSYRLSRAYAMKVTFQGLDDTVLGLSVKSVKRGIEYRSAVGVHCTATDPASPWNNVGDNVNSFKIRNYYADVPRLYSYVNAKYSTQDLDDSNWETGDALTTYTDNTYKLSLYKGDVADGIKFTRFWAGDSMKAAPHATWLVRIRSNEAIKDMLPPITGMDKNGNDKVEANELQIFMDVFGMYRTSMAPVMAKIVHDAVVANEQLTWAGMIAKLKAVYGAEHVEFSLSNFNCEEVLPEAEWDLNEDGTLDDDEILHVIAEKGMLMKKGREMKEKWETMTDEIADDDGDRRARAIRVKRGLGVAVKVGWSDFVKEEFEEITSIVDFEGDRFCIEKVTRLMKRLWGQVVALWTAAIDAAAEAAVECAAAVANLVAGILSLNPIALGKGLLGGVSCAKNVMELLQLKEEIPAIKSTIKEVQAAVKQGHKAVKSWVNDIRALPNNLMNFACNALTRGLEATVDFTWTKFEKELPCVTIGSEGGTCGDGPNPTPTLDPGIPPVLPCGVGTAQACDPDPAPPFDPEIATDMALTEINEKVDAQAALSPCDQYQVVRGDTLSHIALAYRNEGYDDVTWQSICDYNRLDGAERKGDGVEGCDFIVPGLVITVCSDKMKRGQAVVIEPYRAGADRHRRRRRASKVPGRHAEMTSAVPEHIMFKVEMGKNSVVSRISNDRREKFRRTLHNSFRIRRSQLVASNKQKDLSKQTFLRSMQANDLKKVMGKKALREAAESKSNRHRRTANTETLLSPHEAVAHSTSSLHRSRRGDDINANNVDGGDRVRRVKKKKGKPKKSGTYGSFFSTWLSYDPYDPVEFCRNNPYSVFKGNAKSAPKYQPPPEGVFGPESWIDCLVDFWQGVVPPNYKELASGEPLKVCVRDQVTDVVKRNVFLLEQRQQDLVYRVAELMYKERRQMEYTWLEYPDVEFPSELTAQKLLQHQAQLRDWNLQMKEAKSTFKSIGWSSFTVDRTQYPEQFAKLGTSTVLMQNGTVVPNERSSTEMSFYIGAPEDVNFYHAEVKDVKVVLYPLKSAHYKDIMVKITKGSESHFYTQDGTRDTMKTFTHRERTYYREYRMNSCETVSVEESTDDYISVSPYGLWKVDVQPAFFGDAEALSGVDRIELRFKLSKAPVEQPQKGLPLFAGDRFANGITGTTTLSYEEADCATSIFEACLPDPCLNGGKCYPSLSSKAGNPEFVCDCPVDWEGKKCGIPNPIDDGSGEVVQPVEDLGNVFLEDPYDTDEDDDYEDEGLEPGEVERTTTTTTIYDAENVDCVEVQDACTAKCELGSERNYVVQTEPAKGGRACDGPLDCRLGEGGCAPEASASSAEDGDGLDMTFVISIIGLLVGIVILVVAVVHCRQTKTPAPKSAGLLFGDESGRETPRGRGGKTFVNPVYGESTTTLARPKKKLGADEEVTGFGSV